MSEILQVTSNANSPPSTFGKVSIESIETSPAVGKKFTILGREEVGGATPNPRRYDWKIYDQMYERQATVRAAIDTIVRVAVNTGYEFVPRTVSDDMSEANIQKVKDFFEGSEGFGDELTYLYYHLLIFGEGYLYVVPNRRRKPSRLKALMPWTVNVKADRHGDVQYYYQQDPDDPTKEGVRYKPNEIIHVMKHNPMDKLYGLSPLESLKSVVLTDILAEDFNKQYFKNGASTGTVFIFNGADEKTISRMRKWINEKYIGSENAHLPLVIDGDVRVEQTSPAMQDMGFEKGRDSIRAQILAVLGVPPAKLGYMETANRSNSAEQDKSFRTETILPLQNLVETAISDQLIRNVLGVHDVMFNHTDADVRDRQEQVDLWKDLVNMGSMSINEVRKLLGYSPIEGGDIHYVMTATGAVPVVDMELYFRLPTVNTDKIPERLHDDHEDHARGPDGSLLGPDPSRGRRANTREVLEAPATKSLQHQDIEAMIDKKLNNLMDRFEQLVQAKEGAS